jgi:hypothetical protein
MARDLLKSYKNYMEKRLQELYQSLAVKSTFISAAALILCKVHKLPVFIELHTIGGHSTPLGSANPRVKVPGTTPLVPAGV